MVIPVLLVGVLLACVAVVMTVCRRRARIRKRQFSLGPVTAQWLSRRGDDR
jgi:hypothetical protein